MPTLGYWPIRGLGAQVHLLLQYTGTEYEGKLHGPDWFGETKPGLQKEGGLKALANLPYFQDGDLFIPQSQAIMAHVARKAGGLYGKTEADQVAVDVLIAQFADLRAPFYSKLVWTTAEGHKEGVAEFLKEGGILDKHVGGVEQTLKEGEFLAGPEVTLADFVAYEVIRCLSFAFPKKIASFPKLSAWFAKFSALDKVKAYEESVKDVPVTPPTAMLPPGINPPQWGGEANPPSLE